jgi:hypothetical protein
MRKLLIALAVLVVTAELVQAQEPVYYPYAPPRKQGIIHRLCEKLDRCSCGSGKTHHHIGCVGSRGTAIFIFGSCWEFFEEPCIRGQPPYSAWNR